MVSVRKKHTTTVTTTMASAASTTTATTTVAAVTSTATVASHFSKTRIDLLLSFGEYSHEITGLLCVYVVSA